MKWSGNDSYATPAWLYEALDMEFGFDLDPCPLNEIPLFNGLDLDWTGRRVFVNPPWSDIYPWVKKALKGEAQVVVMVLPARTDTAWWHSLNDSIVEMRHFRKRVVFNRSDGSLAERPTDGALIAVIRQKAVAIG